MKRYWLFECDQYYPQGGMFDFVGDFDTVAEADAARGMKFDISVPFAEIKDDKEREKRWSGHHILDSAEKKIVQGWNECSKKIITPYSI